MSNQRAQKASDVESVPASAGAEEAKVVDTQPAEETAKKAPKVKRAAKKAEAQEPAAVPAGGETADEQPKKAKRAPKTPKEPKEPKEAKAPRPKAAAAGQQGGEEKKDEKKERTFTVVRVTKDGVEAEFKGGRFASPSPSSAARKGARHACKAYGEGKVEIDIKMQETTKDSGQKEYAYHAVRVPADEKDVSFKTASGVPVKVPFKFQMILHAIKPPKAAKPTEVAA
jgi:hypothetical protein